MSFFLQGVLITLGLATMMIQPVYADTNCAPIYGGGQSCITSNIALQKRVLNPHTGNYVHDLGLVDNKFMPGDTTTFQLTVTDTGSVTLNDVSILESLPNHMTFISSSTPRNDSPDISFTLGDLAPGQSKSLLITARLDTGNQFGNTGSLCLINRAKASASNAASLAFDSSQLCVFHPQNFAAPVPAATPITPGTGPNFLSSLLLPATGMLGIMIKTLEQKFFMQKEEKS